MKTKTNLFLYLLTDFLAFCFARRPRRRARYYYYHFFAKNNSRYPDKKNLKELLKISNPFIVSYHIATEKKEIKVI
jgi:hypothetical protein